MRRLLASPLVLLACALGCLSCLLLIAANACVSGAEWTKEKLP